MKNDTVQALLAPVRAHAALAPLKRLEVDASKILADMIFAMRGADRRTEVHVTETLDVLMPKLYDLWDAAAHAYYHNSRLRWLEPLARAGIAPDGWDFEKYPEGPEGTED